MGVAGKGCTRAFAGGGVGRSLVPALICASKFPGKAAIGAAGSACGIAGGVGRGAGTGVTGAAGATKAGGIVGGVGRGVGRGAADAAVSLTYLSIGIC